MTEILLEKEALEKCYPFIDSVQDQSDKENKQLWINFKNGLALSVIWGDIAYGGGHAKYEIACFNKHGAFDNTLFDDKDRERNCGDDVLGFCILEKVLHYVMKLGTMKTKNRKPVNILEQLIDTLDYLITVGSTKNTINPQKRNNKQMKKLVEKFQCPGCVCGSDTECGKYNYDPNDMRCTSHVLGSMAGAENNFALGMPKGFDRPGFTDKGKAKSKMDIRLWEAGKRPEWDELNVPVWAMEKDGFLFVRTFAPRINFAWTDVIENGTIGMCPKAIDVSKIMGHI
jgi:hypothetical protein